MGLAVLEVPLPARNLNLAAAHMVRAGRTVLVVPSPAEDLDLMTNGTVLAILMALGHMARVGQRAAPPLRKANLDHITNQIRTTGREISTTRIDRVISSSACLFSRLI
jgi:hypothetical protein